MAVIIRMPEVLTGVTEAAIATWLVSAGQDVTVGTPLAEIETDKAVVEYASEVEGTVLRVLAEAGAGLAVGDPIIAIGNPGETVDAFDRDTPPEAADSVDPEAPSATAATKEPSPTSEPAAALETQPEERRFVSPLVRRLAIERGIDLADVTGSGPNGRVVRRDIDALHGSAESSPSSPRSTAELPSAAPASASAVATESPSAQADPQVEDVPLTSMRRAIARRLTESKSTVPHFYLTADCRVDQLLDLRGQINEGTEGRVSVNDFVLKAVAGALRAVPDANATWGDTFIRHHHSVDIAVAVAIKGGLVTPVVRDVDRLSISEISRTVSDLAERARAGRLKQSELDGGAFTVSNLGMFGTQEFTAIINPPHAGILAVGAAKKRPVIEADELAVGTVMTVTLSADHRVVDGAVAAEWLREFVARIESPLRILA